MNYSKGYILDYKQLKPGTKTVYLLKRVYIPVREMRCLSIVSCEDAAKTYLNEIPTKTIFQSIGSSSITYDAIIELERDPVLYDVCNDYSLDICTTIQ